FEKYLAGFGVENGDVGDFVAIALDANAVLIVSPVRGLLAINGDNAIKRRSARSPWSRGSSLPDRHRPARRRGSQRNKVIGQTGCHRWLHGLVEESDWSAASADFHFLFTQLGIDRLLLPLPVDGKSNFIAS